MRAIIQRVSFAKVVVDEKIVGEIGNGLLVLAGWEEADTSEDLEWLSGKITRLRIFNDEAGLMNLALNDINIFGADMKVSLLNDGPVTIFMDSKDRE
ncbi:MAG: D-aminoacyl-tRNA deacylase [Bacteroidetes bacterium]|nr:D-aminoacyl-tRNA deacylase [Bacteroidota bacterium]